MSEEKKPFFTSEKVKKFELNIFQNHQNQQESGQEVNEKDQDQTRKNKV